MIDPWCAVVAVANMREVVTSTGGRAASGTVRVRELCGVEGGEEPGGVVRSGEAEREGA